MDDHYGCFDSRSGDGDEMMWIFLACKDGVQPEEIPVVCSDAITYETVGEPFLRNYCTGCHASNLEEGERFGAPISVNLDSYSDARQWSLRSYVRTVHFQTMPPSGGIDPVKMDLFKRWTLCGAKGTATDIPNIEPEPRPTSRTIYSKIEEVEAGVLVLNRNVIQFDLVASDEVLIREERYLSLNGLISFGGYDEWSEDGELISSVRFEPSLPITTEEWIAEQAVEVSIWYQGDSWVESQNWMGLQEYQSLMELDVHDRETSPLHTVWWNDQGEEWGWRTSSDKLLSSAYGTTVRGLHWESQQFFGPDFLGGETDFPIGNQDGWIDLWIEWME